MKNVKKEKLTAYALGELSPTEGAEIEEIVQNNPELQKEVEEIKSFAMILSQELKEEALPYMDEKSRAEIFNEVSASEVKEPWWQNLLQGRMLPVGAVMAACLGMLVFFVVQQEMLHKESQPQTPLGLETSLVLKDEANRPQLIPRPTPKSGASDSLSTAEDREVRTKSEQAVGGSVQEIVRAEVAQSGAKRKRKKLFSAFNGGLGNFAFIRNSYTPRPYGDSYASQGENVFKSVKAEPLSTFSIDVDTASYANLRRFIKDSSSLPPADSVRIEEMINYFDYHDPAPTGADPFSVTLEVADSPWATDHQLVRIALKGKVFPKKNHKTNLVFLVDVSGSMDSQDKIGLLKEGLHKLVEELDENDSVSLVTYAGNSAVVLDATSADQKKTIHQAIDNLTAGGSTHGSQGITTAYKIAKKNFRKEGVNRVILASDGDFNVGTTDDEALVELVQKEAKGGVFLTVLGFGRGNLNDSMMEKVSNKGNGNYFYIDSEKEAKKVLVDKLQGTLIAIAKDVKIQVEFNPENVSEYRLIGYENRQLAAKDFNDDKKDAGEIGAGHSVVALYEIKPAGYSEKGVDSLKYQPVQKKEKKVESTFAGELLTVKLRYKQAKESKSRLLKFTLPKQKRSFASASADFRWTASVAGFGMLLKNSQHKGDLTYDKLLNMAEKARWSGQSYDSYRSEFVELVKKAKRLSGH